jgi:hypothetical protein
MKSTSKLILLSVLFVAISSIKLQQVSNGTPKADDLLNHFGTEPDNNKYGAQTKEPINPAREGYTGPGTNIKQITNFEKEILDPSKVVASGELVPSTNAGEVITPKIAGI